MTTNITPNRFNFPGAHDDEINCVRLAPGSDAKMFASGSKDQALKIWDLESGACIQTLEKEKYKYLDRDRVNTCCISPRQTFCVCGTNGGIVKMWKIENGRMICSLRGHSDEVSCCAIAYDGSFVVSGSLDSTLKVWDVELNKERGMLTGHDGAITECCISYDNTFIASSSRDFTIRLWDVSSLQCYQTFIGHTNWVTSVCITRNNDRIVTSSKDMSIKIWNLSTGEVTRTFEDDKPINSSCISNQADIVISTSGNVLKIWDIASGFCKKVLEKNSHSDEILSCCIASDDTFVISAGKDRSIRIYMLDQNDEE